MSSSLPPQKREGRLGLALTSLLCLGFLYWWFRPARETWQPHSTAQLVARALAEPGLNQPLERLVIDFDLMETAILQARLAMIPESLETAARIADPLVQARAIRQLAQAQLNQDPKHLGDALTMCERIGDLALRARMKEDILLQIAMLGFADAALPEATTPLLRARLARRLAETDDQETARSLLAAEEAALPSLPTTEGAALLPELAWTRVHLAIADGPQQAFDAIRRLPAPAQDELWLDLFRVCFGRADSAAADSAAVAAQVTSPTLRRQIELESLQSNLPLREAAAILAELQQELQAAAPGPDPIHLLLLIADAHRRTSGPEAAAIPLHTALLAAQSLPDPVQRATLLAELAETLPDALLFAESKQALTEARDAARTIVAPDQRLPLLILILRHAFNTGEIKTAADLAAEALELAPKVPLAPALTQEFADFLTRLGDWPAALSLLPPPPPATAPIAPSDPLSPRLLLLDAIATTAAEDAIGYDPADPPNRGEPLDRIRNRAVTDEAAAAAYLPAIPAGFARARATLALAKGRLLPPLPSTEAPLPSDLDPNPALLPGPDPAPPLLPEEPAPDRP